MTENIDHSYNMYNTNNSYNTYHFSRNRKFNLANTVLTRDTFLVFLCWKPLTPECLQFRWEKSRFKSPINKRLLRRIQQLASDVPLRKFLYPSHCHRTGLFFRSLCAHLPLGQSLIYADHKNMMLRSLDNPKREKTEDGKTNRGWEKGATKETKTTCAMGI